jgi:hypothetical protein
VCTTFPAAQASLRLARPPLVLLVPVSLRRLGPGQADQPKLQTAQARFGKRLLGRESVQVSLPLLGTRCPLSSVNLPTASTPLTAPPLHRSGDRSYTPKQLYAVIADVDSYKQFVPFATDSRVLIAKRAGTSPDEGEMSKLAKEQAWLRSFREGEEWEMKAQLRIGAMNFNEAYTSKVTTRNWDKVTVSIWVT